VNQHLKNPRLQYSLKQWGSEEDSVELTGRVIIYSEFNQTSGADNRALCKASMTKDKGRFQGYRPHGNYREKKS
jgi:hypothetical protein